MQDRQEVNNTAKRRAKEVTQRGRAVHRGGGRGGERGGGRGDKVR